MQTDRDCHLLQKIAQGDESALQKLYQQYGGHILNYLDGLLQDKALAEEVLQDVMLIVWQSAARFRGESKVRTWLYSIARNRASKAMRGRKFYNIPLNTDIAKATGDKIAQIDRQDALRSAFRELPLAQREVIELTFFHGFKMAEIAEALDIPLGTVLSRLSRAKQQLRHLLEREGIDHA